MGFFFGLSTLPPASLALGPEVDIKKKNKYEYQLKKDGLKQKLEDVNDLILAESEKNNTSLNQTQKKAREIQRQLHDAESEIKSISKTEAKILTQLNETERLLNQIRKETMAMQVKLFENQKKIKTRHNSLIQLEKRIEDNEKYISKRLVSLYKLSWLGQLPLLASANSSVDFFKRKANLEFILDHDQLAFKQLQEEKKKNKQMLTQLKVQQQQQKNMAVQLQQQKEALSIQRAKRVEFLSQIQKRKDLQLAAIVDLKNSAEKLNQTIEFLSKQSQKSTALKALSGTDFSKFKGLLNLPVKGKIIHFYGRYKNKKLNVDNFRTGITIQADRGEPIRSVAGGKTIFADWFRGYGNMIIIDHGNHYYTVYAHLEEVFKSKGDRVEADEVIATVGDTGSMGDAGLHFEVRHHGKPLDPMEWIRKG